MDLSDATDTIDALLCGDALQSIFLHLQDAYALASMALVCKAWREVVCDANGDLLWGEVVRTRWKLQEKKNRRYKYGERSWREVFRVFHRRNRLPNFPGISMQRDVIYAAGRQSRVACWLIVNHQPACRLASRGGDSGDGGESEASVDSGAPVAAAAATRHGGPWKVLQARVMVQNLRSSNILLAPDACLNLTLRDGVNSRPLPTMLASTDGGRDGSGETGAKVMGAPSSHVRLAPLEVCMLSDVSFPVPHHMEFEPDVLEACHSMRVRATACIGPHRSVPIDVPCSFAPEAEIWDHYERISPQFYVHHDAKDD